MTSSELLIVPLTHGHLVEMFGEDGRGPTVKGVAALVAGKVAGIGGIAYAGGKVIAFCNVKPEMRAYKTAIHRAALRTISEAKTRHRAIWAECDGNEATAPRWLTRLGFKPHEGTIWVCLASKQ